MKGARGPWTDGRTSLSESGDSLLHWEQEATLAGAGLRAGPAGEPPAPAPGHRRSPCGAPLRAPTWVQMVPLINDRKEINVSRRRIPQYWRSTFHKYPADTPQNCQGHQKQGKSEELFQQRGDQGGLTAKINVTFGCSLGTERHIR